MLGKKMASGVSLVGLANLAGFRAVRDLVLKNKAHEPHLCRCSLSLLPLPLLLLPFLPLSLFPGGLDHHWSQERAV